MATDSVSAVVYLSHGRWVARCPRPGCANAEAFGRCDDGTVGGLAADGFNCRASHGGCGLQCAAQWPANRPDIEALTLGRPAPSTRNWLPGETLDELLAENMEHGLVPVVGRPVAIAGEGDEQRILPPELTPGHDARRELGR